jgi:PAS domain-containing protein
MAMREGDERDPAGRLAAHAGPRIELIAQSFRRLVGRDLVGGGPDLAGALWVAPQAIVAHGTEPDAVFFYGNQLALSLFETPAEDFVQMPSRRSAEPMHREARARLLDEVTRRGFIDDYSGVRISAAGRRFRIEQAIVWNLIDEDGRVHGQAATFANWTRLD